jgi:RecJ-like exonuclease
MVCPECDGNGYNGGNLRSNIPCPHCKGLGFAGSVSQVDLDAKERILSEWCKSDPEHVLAVLRATVPPTVFQCFLLGKGL